MRRLYLFSAHWVALRTSPLRTAAFTLVEILIAAVAASVLLVAIFGIFQWAMSTRDQASARSRESSFRARAASIIRNDLRNAYISGTAGVLASTLEGSVTNPNSSYPGYLSLTVTTGKDAPAEMYGDVQQVEYYISAGTSRSGLSNAVPPAAGTLVRAVTRDLLDSTPAIVHEQSILPNVQSFEVTFYDGQAWQPAWSLSGSNPSSGLVGATSATTTGTGNIVPDAILVHIQQAPATVNGPAPAPMDVMVPWTTSPFHSGTIAVTGT